MDRAIVRDPSGHVVTEVRNIGTEAAPVWVWRTDARASFARNVGTTDDPVLEYLVEEGGEPHLFSVAEAQAFVQYVNSDPDISGFRVEKVGMEHVHLKGQDSRLCWVCNHPG